MLLGPNHAALYRDHCCQVLASFQVSYTNKNGPKKQKIILEDFLDIRGF
jgi:hypothetical protein